MASTTSDVLNFVFDDSSNKLSYPFKSQPNGLPITEKADVYQTEPPDAAQGNIRGFN